MTEPTFVTVEIKRHGTRYSYQKGCHCDECTKAQRDNQMRANASRKLRPEETPHGTRGGYCNWGCRCDLCTKANSDYMKNYRKT